MADHQPSWIAEAAADEWPPSAGLSGFRARQWSTIGLSSAGLSHFSAPPLSSSASWLPLAWEPTPPGGLAPPLPALGPVDGSNSPPTPDVTLPYHSHGYPLPQQYPSASIDWHSPNAASSYSQPAPPLYLGAASSNASSNHSTYATLHPLPPPQHHQYASESSRRPIPLRRQTTLDVVTLPWTSTATSEVAPTERASLLSESTRLQPLRPTPTPEGVCGDSAPPAPTPSHPSSVAPPHARLWNSQQHSRSQSLDGRTATGYEHLWKPTGTPFALQPLDRTSVFTLNAPRAWSPAQRDGSQPVAGPSTQLWEQHSGSGKAGARASSLSAPSAHGETTTPPSPQLVGRAAVEGKPRRASLKSTKKAKRRKSDGARDAPRKHVCEHCNGTVAFSRPSALKTHLVSVFAISLGSVHHADFYLPSPAHAYPCSR